MLGSHLRFLILEEVHLLFTIQPAMVNMHVDAVKWKSVKELLSVYKRSVATKINLLKVYEIVVFVTNKMMYKAGLQTEKITVLGGMVSEFLLFTG